MNEPATFQSINSIFTLDTALVCRAGACVGDLNIDGIVDDADFSLFVPAYNEYVCP